ncbi:MAG: signal peptide peptidase SppA [Nitrospirota bacterium]
MKEKMVRTGLLYFLALSLLFFLFMFWMGRTGDRGKDFPKWQGGEQIGLVRIEGVIIGSEEVTKILTRLEEDNQIKAILLRIDSPGGAVVPSQEIYDAVKKIRLSGKKKIVTSMGTVAASGGYYIAAASNYIIANPGTLTGSLGVIMEMANFEGLMQKIGVESVTIKSGANKDAGSPFRKMTEGERLLFQNVLDDVHAQFMEAVSEGRSMEMEKVRLLADGRIFTGRQAKENGLVDGLGNLEDAITKTAELSGIKGKPDVVETRENIPFLKMLEGRFLGKVATSFPIRLNYLLSF